MKKNFSLIAPAAVGITAYILSLYWDDGFSTLRISTALISDILFVSGMAYLLLGLFMICHNSGFFNIVTYSFKWVAQLFKSKNSKLDMEEDADVTPKTDYATFIKTRKKYSQQFKMLLISLVFILSSAVVLLF